MNKTVFIVCVLLAIAAGATWLTQRSSLVAAVADLQTAAGWPNKAFSRVNRAIKSDPAHPALRLSRCKAYFEMARYALALDDCDRVLTNGTPRQQAQAQLYRGRVYYMQQDFEKAVREFSAAFATDTAMTDGLYWRGQSRMRMGETKPAIEDFERFLETGAGRRHRYQAQCHLQQLNNNLAYNTEACEPTAR